MRPVTGEWVAKAEGDFDVMEREMRAHKKPNYDAEYLVDRGTDKGGI